MKNAIKLGLIFITISLASILSSCDNVLALGGKIDLSGPVVTIDENWPVSRQPITGTFLMKGTVKDNTGVDRMVVKVRYSKETVPGSGQFVDTEYDKQWRFFNNKWEVSNDFGRTWAPLDSIEMITGDPGSYEEAKWSGDKASIFQWELPIDLELTPGDYPSDGQYQFNVTAWNPAGNSDSNSFKTRTVTLFKDPPLVTIIAPFLYPAGSDELNTLVTLPNTEASRQNPLYLGKFLNGPINLQWQIDSPNDVWSIDIRFYKTAVLWDPATPPVDYVYRINIPVDGSTRPPALNPNDAVKPNGRAVVPDLSSSEPIPSFVPKTSDGQGGYYQEQKGQITDKTPMYAVVFCTDAAGNVLDDNYKFQGYFVYWPQADIPWIILPDGLKESYGDAENPYTVFPEAVISARSYDDDGIARVDYKLSSITNLSEPAKLVTLTNGSNSRVFSWQFNAPVEAGDYYIEAQTFDINGVSSIPVGGRFTVKDSSYPEILPPTKPLASNPLFKYITGPGGVVPASINDWTIDISGTATDFTGIKSVSMVWINPHSVNYAAMSQLNYFRDPNYDGWIQASTLPPGGDPYLDKTYDSSNPNKVWILDVTSTPRTYNAATNRWEYTYKKTLNLKTDLNIAPGMLDQYNNPYDYLKSQVFVLKVTDMDGDGKSSIITWAPQGDTEAPKVRITSVMITRGGVDFPPMVRDPVTGNFGYIDPLPQFQATDKITVKGTWTEDSTGDYSDTGGKLDIVQTVLKNNLVITVGKDNRLDGTSYTTKTINPITGKAVSGDWTATGTVGSTTDYALYADALKDTLVISAKLTDLGGNISEDGASWLIQSDELRFLRVGSDTPDGIYSDKKNGDPVDIDVYLEFNKPVTLVSSLSDPTKLPRLLLNSGAIAVYDTGNPDHHESGDPNKPIIPSSRQHFKYTVGNSDTTGSARLNVANLLGSTNGTAGDGLWNTDTYPFIWKTAAGTIPEQIRMVMTIDKNPGGLFLLGKLPVRNSPNPTPSQTDPDDYLYTLMAGKNIIIDTTPPKLVSLVKNVKNGWYGIGNFLYFTATFNKSIQVGTGGDAPRLVMNLKKKGTSGNIQTTDVQINDTQVIFSYEIQENDYTPGTEDSQTSPIYGGYLSILRLDGTITDLAQNIYTPATGTQPDFPKNFNTTTGTSPNWIQVKAVKPLSPTLNVMVRSLTAPYTYSVVSGVGGPGTSGGDSITGNWNPGNFTDTAAFIADTTISKNQMKNIYIDNLYILIEPNGVQGTDYDSIEYSVNYGKDWAPYSTPFATPKEQTAPGLYALTARQIDMAGNVSDWTKPVTLNWDKGDLLTRITSSAANGVFTNNTSIGGGRADEIPISLYFRKPITFKARPVITLSVLQNESDSNSQWQQELVLTPTPNRIQLVASADRMTYTFLYPVGITDTTGGQKLNLIKLDNISAVDDDNVDVSSLINLNLVKATQTELNILKDIKIQTGYPKRSVAPYFSTGTINNPDDSYWTTLNILFDRAVYKGGSELYDYNSSGTIIGGPYTNQITIIQSADRYRLPSVLTETQWNKYQADVNKELLRKASNGLTPIYTTSMKIEDFYTKGVNGYSSGAGPDTSTKYILNFQYDTYSITPDRAGTDIQQLAEAFRQVEQVTLVINSSVISVSNVQLSPNEVQGVVTVSLTNNNALKVPGASYEIKYPAGLVQDLLGNPCEIYPPADAPEPAPAPTDPNSDAYKDYYGIKAIGEIAKPFIRVSKPQGTISTDYTYSSQSPRLKAIQPGQAQVRMDCRTPGSVVRYAESTDSTSTTTVSGTVYPATITNINNSTTENNFWRSGPIGEPYVANPTGTSSNFGTVNVAVNSPFSIGPSATSNIYQGYMKRYRAVGAIGTTGSTLSSSPRYSEELIYRSVLTFKGVNITPNNGQTFTDGDQLWVRGANTLFGTTIPGYPLTPDDDYAQLNATGQRAGTRLMSMIIAPTGTATLASATWQWVTWDINVAAYITVYLGHDLSSSAAQAFQYGPLAFASQTGNWSLLQSDYRLYPGSHIWLSSSMPDNTGSGARAIPFTFNGSFYLRPDNADLQVTSSMPVP